jgi:hypothetical protein
VKHCHWIALFLITETANAQQVKQPQNCPSLRALDGSCADAGVVAQSQHRSISLSTVRTSYAGSAGEAQSVQPVNRFFQENPLVFGLPTVTTSALDGTTLIITRTK